MYDDLLRTQRRSGLEQLVVHVVIPTLLTTFVIHCQGMSARRDGMSYMEGNCFEEDLMPMRGFSSVASVTVHVAVGVAVLFGTSKTGRSNPKPPRDVVVVFPQPTRSELPVGVGVPTIGDPAIPDVPVISLPSALLQAAAPSHASFPTYVPSTVTTGGVPATAGWAGAVDEARPELLTGPLPTYPDLLRQAGIEGQVLLEAVVDSTGRVQAASISVVLATNPGFVEPARQALRRTLFRPARVNGRAVSMLVRVPFAFSIRGGTGRAR